MVFNSQAFLFFILPVFLIFWLLSPKLRLILLLLASYFFYGFSCPKLTLLLLLVTTLSYFIAILIENTRSPFKKKLYLCASSVILILPLIYFKYFNFIISNINGLFNTSIAAWDIILPVGISFYTFQTISYLIDVYRRDIPAERSFVAFALYVSFFPQLVAGPIERASNFLPQLKKSFHYSSENFKTGLKIALWGLFKKIVIADRLAAFVEPVYHNHTQMHGITLLIATVFFAFQIYCDFSGYSDMAIGIAKLWGLDLMKNFNRPYIATSLVDFWRRWHISLSTWFKDYIYRPLGGNQVGIRQWVINILLVFAVSGLWHGAKWTFVAWGLVHAIGMIIVGIFSDRYNKALTKVFKYSQLVQLLNFSLTFIFVNVTWVFFRAENLTQSFEILRKIGHLAFNANLAEYGNILLSDLSTTRIEPSYCLSLLLGIIVLYILEYYQGEEIYPSIFDFRQPIIRRFCQYALLLTILLFGSFGASQFIYFQF